MRPQSMTMLGLFAMIDLLAMFALFSEPSAEPSSLALCEPLPADVTHPVLAEEVLLTAQHTEFLGERQETMEPRFGPSDDDPMPVPVYHDKMLDDGSPGTMDDKGQTNGAGGSMRTTSLVGI